MKPHIFHQNLAGRIASADTHLLLGIATFSDESNKPSGRARHTHERAQIFEAKLTSIPEIPHWLGKIGELALRVDFAVRNLPSQLSDRKSIRTQAEARGKVRHKRKEPQPRHLEFLPADPP